MKLAIVLDTRRKLKSVLYPVVLRFTEKKDRLYIGVKFEITDEITEWIRVGKRFNFANGDYIALPKEDFDRVQGNDSAGRLKNVDSREAKQEKQDFEHLRTYLQAKQEEALTMIGKLPVQSIQALKEAINRKREATTRKEIDDVIEALKQRENELKKQGRISTLKTFTGVRKSFEVYLKNKPLPFEAVNLEWLNKYEKWMRAKGNTPTTVGIYLRNVRTIINSRIEAGKLDHSVSPFGRKGYQIPTGANVKKALTIDQVRTIAAYEPINDIERFYRDLWLFSYFCNGMNPTDVCNLRFENFSNKSEPFAVDQYFTFERKKTEGKNSKPVIIRVAITEPVSQILNRWAKASKLGYVFGMLNRTMTPESRYQTIQQFVKQQNKYMGRIANQLGIAEKVTTYVARHSFATVLKRSGVSTEYISESLGHTSLKTTANYLDTFENAKVLENAKKLI